MLQIRNNVRQREKKEKNIKINSVNRFGGYLFT